MFTTGELAEKLGAELIGNPNVRINRIGEPQDSGEDVIVIALEKSALKKVKSPGAIILSKDIPTLAIPKLITQKGKDILIDILELFYPEKQKGFISPQAVIGKDVEIGEGTVIYPGVVIYDGCKIGKNCIIHANAVIGADGFGFVQQKDGTYRKIPQKGIVIIEDDVEIGAGTTIDRATINATVIGKGTKIDNKVHIAHNVKIGKNCILAGASNVAGSSVLEDNVILAGGAGIADNVTIGKGAVIAACTVATSDVPPGAFIYATPTGTEYASAIKAKVLYNKLPELFERLKEIEKKLK